MVRSERAATYGILDSGGCLMPGYQSPLPDANQIIVEKSVLVEAVDGLV